MLKHLRHMAIFCRIIDTGSISRAAEELAVSKSVVSQHLKSLEDSLGVPLLRRTTRKQQLTPAGQDFYNSCQQMLNQADNAWKQAQESQGQPNGPLTISAPHAFIADIIAPALGKLCTQYPKIKPNIEAEDLRVDSLSREIDLIVRVGKLTDSTMIQRKLGDFKDVLCASPTYRNQIQNQLVQDQTKLNTITCDYIANHWQGKKLSHKLTHQHTGEIVELNFTATRFSNSLPGVIAMAQAGAGLALIPDFIFAPLNQTGSLVPVFPDLEGQSNPVYALHDYGKKPPLAIKLAIQELKDSFPR